MGLSDSFQRPVAIIITGMNEYHSGILAGARAVFDRCDVPFMVVANEPYAANNSELTLALIEKRALRGVLLLPTISPERGQELHDAIEQSGLPTVYVGRETPGRPSVCGENETGMRTLMEHLLDERGVRSPVLIRGLLHQRDSVIREEIFRRELALRGIPIDEQLMLTGNFKQDQSYQALHDLLHVRRDLDAVVALNDESALGAMGALSDLGIRVPQDVLVSGFDNSLAASWTWPGLTTVDQGIQDQGTLAAEMLLTLLEGREPEVLAVVPSQLITRASTAPRGQHPMSATPAENGSLILPGSRLVDGTWVVDVDNVIGEFEWALTAAQSARTRLVTQNSMMGMSRTMIQCRSVQDVVTSLSSRLDHLGIRRCYFVLERRETGMAPDRPLEELELILSYRDGEVLPSPEAIFSYETLLPGDLREELRTGPLFLQPLGVASGVFGYLLFEAERESEALSELLRVDLSRALDTVFHALEMEAHAQSLERLVAQRTSELEQANQELRLLAMSDGLTKIMNRAAFDLHLQRQGLLVEKEGICFALLMLDVDFFKAYNDRYGHVQGDVALQTVASCLSRAAREERDIACRYGGEEFALILPDTGLEGALAVVARFRTLLCQAEVLHEGSTVDALLTASIGIAVARPDMDRPAAEVLGAADRALYLAKTGGRNRWVVDEGALTAD